MQDNKPTTHQRGLTKLPGALAPLTARRQFTVWRWTLQNGRWQKPPFMAEQPERHASTKDPGTWCDYATALATVQAGKADGISYVLTEADPFAAIDLDHCRHPDTGSIDVWAQNFLDVARSTYSEVTPSGEGCRIWGLTSDASTPVNRKFSLEIEGKKIAAELFRRTPKALTITGYRLDSIRELTNIDRVFDRAVVWGERRKAAVAAATQINGNSFNGGGLGHDIEHIEQLVRDGAGDANRSDKFHAVVGHYVGCGRSEEQIYQHLRQFPGGIAGRYLAEGRLAREISRSASKYSDRALPLLNGWTAPEKIVEARETPSPAPVIPDLGEPEIRPVLPETADEDFEDELKPVSPKPETPDSGEDSELEDDDSELEDDDPELAEDDDLGEQLYLHWDRRPGPVKKWLIKHLVPECGTGLISGQNGTYKSFIAFDLLVASLATGQPFLGHPVKRQCGGMLIAAEGADEMDLRLKAVIREKCGGLDPIPFSCWREEIPQLLHKDSSKAIVEKARRVDAAMQEKFGLPLGLIVIDTLTACAGYRQSGEGNDTAVGAAIMGVLRTVAQAIGCFVFIIDHLGKNVEAGTRGTVAKEDAADVVWILLGQKSLSGTVANIRLAIRKHRGGKHGQEYPFTVREVAEPELDEDGDPVTTLVVDWQPAGATGSATAAKPEPDPWAVGRQQDQRTAILRLKRVLMDILAGQGVDLPIPPDGPTVRMVDQEIVREQFYSHTPVEGSPKQKRQLRFQQFKRALGRAEEEQLIGIGEINDVTYLWLSRPDQEEDEGC